MESNWGADEAPDDPAFYDAINRLSGAAVKGSMAPAPTTRRGLALAGSKVAREAPTVSPPRRRPRPASVELGSDTRSRIIQGEDERRGVGGPSLDSPGLGGGPEGEAAAGRERCTKDQPSRSRSTTLAAVEIAADGLWSLVAGQGWYPWCRVGDEERAKNDQLDEGKAFGQSRVLHESIECLREGYGKLPKAPHFEEQIGHLELDKESEMLCKYISDAISQMNDESKALADKSVQPSATAARRAAIVAAYRRMVSILILCLRQAFLVGVSVLHDGEASSDRQDSHSMRGCFTAATMQPLIMIAHWIDALCGTMCAGPWLRPKDPAAEPGWQDTKGKADAAGDEMESLWHEIQRFQRQLQSAAEALEEEVGEGRERIMNGHAFETEKKARQRSIEAQEGPKRFLVAVRRRRPAADADEEQDEADYEKKHGWRLWEDERLLDAMRKGLGSDERAVLSLVPGRSRGEIAERMGDLRRWMRLRFATMGLVPPRWCYRHEAEEGKGEKRARRC